MKRILIALALISFLCLPNVVKAIDTNLMVIPFHLGTTAAAVGTESMIVRVPQQCTISSVWLTDYSGFVANSTDYTAVTFYLNNAANGVLTSSSTAFVATTPLRLVPTDTILEAGDILQFKVTKTGAGKATTDLGATVIYYNTTSGH